MAEEEARQCTLFVMHRCEEGTEEHSRLNVCSKLVQGEEEEGGEGEEDKEPGKRRNYFDQDA
jgi:hypothetical protein